MKHIKALTNWLDQHILELIAGFLLIFIPLYPKWPLADVLPGYIVRLRLEDIFVGLAGVIWLVQLVRKKVSFRKNPLAIPITIYIFIGLLSSLSALFITKTVPLERIHVAKLFLHWLRRGEYMSLAFIFFSAVKTPRQIRRMVTFLASIVLIVTIYGLGQKHLMWPVYSTMNREFAKGWRLVLTEHARVPSTFAGHYDLAAFTVIALAIFTSLLLSLKKTETKKYLPVLIAAFLSLLLTASRTSFIAYLVAITVVVVLLTTRRTLKWGISRWLIIISVSLLSMTFFGDLSQRFAHFFKVNEIKEYVLHNIFKLEPRVFETAYDDLSLVYTQTDQPPIPAQDDLILPPDVFEEIPESFPEATLSSLEATRAATVAGKPRSYSPAAFTFGLSSAIRFDALWPRAIEGLKKNFLLGSGYSTLVKTQVTQFTEAESTDNDYLRALGETGILGFTSFFAIFGFTLYKIWKAKDKVKEPYLKAFIVGVGGAIVGMLVNGLYIDVFEASKVAYIFWALLGLLFATLNMTGTMSVKKKLK